MQANTPTDEYSQPHKAVQLQPISPEEALDIHLGRMREDSADWTVQSHKSRLSWFIDWCDAENIDNLNDLTGRDILRYRDHRRQHNAKDSDDTPISKATLKTNLDTLRVYLQHAANADGVHPRLPDQIDPPTLSSDDHSRDVHIESDRADKILENLRKYRYASVEHLLFELMWHTGMRMGGVRALDLDDIHHEDLYIQLKHRKESDTPLKNKSEGERPVAISDGISRLVNDYVNQNRTDTEDEFGRDPLITTQHGRISLTNIRNTIYSITRPCEFGTCPHKEREPHTCEAAQRVQWASKCPDSVSPHAVRRGALTHWLNQDWEREAVSERANVSERVLADHYDQRSDLRKMEQRRSNLDKL